MKYLLECDYTVSPKSTNKRVTTDVFNEPVELSVVVHYLMKSVQNMRWTETMFTITGATSIEVQEFDRAPTIFRIVEVP